jgi:hypothetical protein
LTKCCQQQQLLKAIFGRSPPVGGACFHYSLFLVAKSNKKRAQTGRSITNAACNENKKSQI